MKFRVLIKNSLVLAIALSTVTNYQFAYGLGNASKIASKSDLLVIRNWGLDNDEYPSHINAKKAWKITKGNKKIVVAVIDTGIDAKHPDLADNLCKKPGSDEYGYDFVLNKKNPGDVHGHGTHVAGIIGAAAKAKTGVGAYGVAPNICIMPIRYYSDSASGAQNLANTVKAIDYAVDNGANIINYSGGGAEFSAAEMKAIKRAEAKGIVFVAAAGNEYQNTDEASNAYYPAAYGLTNIIAVAATNIKNQLLTSSNWGKKHVHVAAPGENIFSTLPKGRYGYLTGTSQATAFVSGLAALILSENPKLKPSEVRNIIMESTDKIDGLKDKIASGGRINAYTSLKVAIAKRDGKDTAKVLAEAHSETAEGSESPNVKRNVAFE